MIRKHNENDLDRIMEIWQESSALAHPFLKKSFVEKVASDMRNVYIPGSETWVYEHDSKPVGFISMLDNEIGGLFVLSEYQLKGIGRTLVNYVEKFHENLEVEVFEKNKIAISFYNKMGFHFNQKYTHQESNENVLRLIN